MVYFTQIRLPSAYDLSASLMVVEFCQTHSSEEEEHAEIMVSLVNFPLVITSDMEEHGI
jgi:hypothetical protein